MRSEKQRGPKNRKKGGQEKTGKKWKKRGPKKTTNFHENRGCGRGQLFNMVPKKDHLFKHQKKGQVGVLEPFFLKPCF